MTKGGFNVLTTMRAIRDDANLTTTQAHLLMCAVLRTDNKTFKVRMSLEGLAKDAGVSVKTAERAFKEEAVLAYFSKVERNSRRVDLWFMPDIESTLPDTVSEPLPDTVSIAGHCVPVAGHSVPVAGHSVRPSTYTSTNTSTHTSTEGHSVPSKEKAGTSNLSFAERVTDAQRLFNRIETSHPSLSTFGGWIKNGYLSLLDAVGATRADALVTLWLAHARHDYSQAAFLNGWQKLNEADLLAQKVSKEDATTRAATKKRTEEWLAKKAQRAAQAAPVAVNADVDSWVANWTPAPKPEPTPVSGDDEW